MNGAAAQHEDLRFGFVEEAIIGTRSNTECTGISAEGRHDEAALVRDKAFAMGAAATGYHGCTRMKVP